MNHLSVLNMDKEPHSLLMSITLNVVVKALIGHTYQSDKHPALACFCLLI